MGVRVWGWTALRVGGKTGVSVVWLLVLRGIVGRVGFAGPSLYLDDCNLGEGRRERSGLTV